MISFILAAILLAIALSGCHGKADTIDPYENELDSYGIEENPESSYSINEYLQSGRTIWYAIMGMDELGKDARVSDIYILKPDGTFTCYDTLDVSEKGPVYTLGQCANLSDDEILEIVDSAAQEFTNGAVMTGEYKLTILTDNTGNSTDYENLVFHFYDYENSYRREYNNIYLKGLLPQPVQVYDSSYVGFYDPSEEWQHLYGNYSMLTRVTDTFSSLYFDNSSEAGLPVDIKPRGYPDLFQ